VKLLLVSLLLALPAFAQPIQRGTSFRCLVVGVSDGDTLKARCGEPGAYEQVTIRLAEIDAPEKAQAFGQRSKEALSGLCFGVEASIKPQTLDRYGRTVARVECRGQDASAELLRQGMAWWFVKYGRDRKLQQIEATARESRIGLWADAAPAPPWDWRKLRRESAATVPPP
jgi:endonuclease YncB( thermonuclease family)